MTLLTTKEVAKKLKFSKEHIRRLIRQGDLKATILGHLYFIDDSELEKVVRKRSPNGQRKGAKKNGKGRSVGLSKRAT